MDALDWDGSADWDAATDREWGSGGMNGAPGGQVRVSCTAVTGVPLRLTWGRCCPCVIAYTSLGLAPCIMAPVCAGQGGGPPVVCACLQGRAHGGPQDGGLEHFKGAVLCCQSHTSRPVGQQAWSWTMAGLVTTFPPFSTCITPGAHGPGPGRPDHDHIAHELCTDLLTFISDHHYTAICRCPWTRLSMA